MELRDKFKVWDIVMFKLREDSIPAIWLILPEVYVLLKNADKNMMDSMDYITTSIKTDGKGRWDGLSNIKNNLATIGNLLQEANK